MKKRRKENEWMKLYWKGMKIGKERIKGRGQGDGETSIRRTHGMERKA